MSGAPVLSARLFGEELAEVGEGFEFEGVAGGVEEEHGGLFSNFAFEAGVGLDDEGDTGGFDAFGEGLPIRLGEDDSKVRNGDVVAVDGVGRRRGGGAGFVVGYDLVAEEVEVDPDVGAATFGAAEDGAVEMAGGGEVVYGEGDVEGAEFWHGVMIMPRWREVEVGK